MVDAVTIMTIADAAITMGTAMAAEVAVTVAADTATIAESLGDA